MRTTRQLWDREQLLQTFLLGAAAANPKLLDDLQESDFESLMGAGVASMKKALNGETKELNLWLERTIGVRRINGEKVIDASLERLRQDAAYRRAEKEDAYTAKLARMLAEMSDRRLRRKDAQ